MLARWITALRRCDPRRATPDGSSAGTRVGGGDARGRSGLGGFVTVGAFIRQAGVGRFALAVAVRWHRQGEKKRREVSASPRLPRDIGRASMYEGGDRFVTARRQLEPPRSR